MTGQTDFERAWLEKLGECLEQTAGDEIRRQVMRGSERLTAASSRDEIIAWTRQAMEQLELLLDEESRVEIMTGCACRHPHADLAAIRADYAEHRSVERVQAMLQERFETMLRERLGLDESLVADIVRRGWGMAGVRDGDRIIATKIPKSGQLAEYMQETDPVRRRQLYCHCPRVRDAIGQEATISTTYCYCGAGYYKDLWQEILQQPVRVELLASVLEGDDVCSFAIHLPDGA